MSIVTGAALNPARFFKPGTLPVAQGSSFDLTIGKIYDNKGQEISGPFVLAPNAMVQVVSAEVFSLPPEYTGHVTYKTGLTREGIWALTVGIVDPGWDGPIATTLLNFSRVISAASTTRSTPGRPFSA
jgi:deoxycytidine triphosphate deaminase